MAADGQPLLGSRTREVSGSKPRRAALVVGSLAVLALVGVVSNVRSASSVQLLDKQQAAWYDGVTVAEEDHKFRRVADQRMHVDNRRPAAVTQKKASAAAVDNSNRNDLKNINNMLTKAVGMLNNLEGKKTASKLTEQKPSFTGGVQTTQARLASENELPKCYSINDVDVAKEQAKSRMSVAADNLAMAYPDWSKAISIPGTGQNGEWRHDRGPPYVQRITLFSGDGVDSVGSGTLVRRILGLHTAFQRPCDLRSCRHAWSNNNFVTTFDGAQMRFLYRNVCSMIVIPPLVNGPGPILGHNGLFRLHHYIKEGHNTLIVLGSVANVLFLNQNIATKDGGFDLVPSWTEGPYEAQEPQHKNTPFAALSVTLPGPGTTVCGVKISSLPSEAISYYEAQDTSVIFEIPMGSGRIIYLGYDYNEPVTGWVHALIAATMFTDYDTSVIPEHLAGSVGRK